MNIRRKTKQERITIFTSFNVYNIFIKIDTQRDTIFFFTTKAQKRSRELWIILESRVSLFQPDYNNDFF